MDFIVSNFAYPKAKQFEHLYYSGNAVRADEECLKVRQSASFRYFSAFAESLADADPCVPLDAEDFYFLADFRKGEDVLRFQTDLVGYEAVFLWRFDGHFAFSDDAVALAECVIRAGFQMELDEEKVREYLFYGQSFFQDTVFQNTVRFTPAAIGTVSAVDGTVEEKRYDEFRMTSFYQSPKEAAEGAKRCLNDYFASHKEEGTCYSIGMSGGLDSRVGAYFAKEHGYDIKPIFIGVKKNAVGWKTNDILRAEKVNSELGFGPIEYFDPRGISLEEKVRHDALHAPCMTNNVSQNMGKLEGVDVLIHAMMGGEAFGQLAAANLENADFEDLCLYLTERVSSKPRYKTASATLRRLSRYFNIEAIAKKWIYCDPKTADELLSPAQREKVRERVAAWVRSQQALGLDNLNIWHKYFYYRFAVMAKTGYYSTFNNTVPTLATYMNPPFVREILKWNPSFLVGMKVQKELLMLLGNLASLRSQTVECSVNDKSPFRKVKKIFYVAERMLRGGAMMTNGWFTDRQIKEYIEKHVAMTRIGQKIRLENKAWFCEREKVPLALMKMAYLDAHLMNVAKDVSETEKIR